MKSSLILIFTLILMNAFGQHPDLLDRTWYVQYVTIDGAQYDVITGGIFYGQVFFDEDLLDVSHPVCEEGFETTITYQGIDQFTFDNSSLTILGICSDPEVIQFMAMHYNLYLEENKIARSPCTYTITEDANGLNLVVTNNIGDIGVYGDYQLGTDDYNLETLKVLNPTEDGYIIVHGDTSKVDGIEILNINGSKLMEFDSLDNKLDISSLQSGIYILIIQSGSEQTVKRIIKE